MLDDDEQPFVVVDRSIRREREFHTNFQLGREDASVLRQLEASTLIRYKLEVEIRIGVVLEKYRSITSSTDFDGAKINRGGNTKPFREGVLLLVDLYDRCYTATGQ